MKWLRVRFYASGGDPAPILWPPPGPFWCTGYTEGTAVVVAYLKEESELIKYWPDAIEPDWQERDSIVFTSRFQKPTWWKLEELNDANAFLAKLLSVGKDCCERCKEGNGFIGKYYVKDGIPHIVNPRNNPYATCDCIAGKRAERYVKEFEAKHGKGTWAEWCGPDEET